MGPKNESKFQGVSPEQRQQFGAIFLLELAIHGDRTFPLLLEGADQELEPLLEWLHLKGYLEIEGDARYAPTAKGQKVIDGFLGRYEDFLRSIDIYGSVDLDEGTFAFEKIFDFDDDRDWREYVDQPRFSDLRVAVAEFKGLDAVELVFMAAVNDGTLNADDDGWQARLVNGEFWTHVETVIRNALRPKDLAHETETGIVQGDRVLEQVIVEGAALGFELRKREAEVSGNATAPGSEVAVAGSEKHTVTEVTTSTTSEFAYVDPYYVSPVWLALWLL
jgi:hypothetical protein